MLNITKNLSKSNKTALIKFYFDNSENKIFFEKKENSLLICNYNVHGWVNINREINCKKNFKNIINLLKDHDIDLLVLEEVCLSIINENYILKKFKKIGFVDYFFAKNGGCFISPKDTDYLLVLGKKEFISKEDINVTKFMFARHCVAIEYDNLKILCVHLEIGKRYHHLQNGNIERKKIEIMNSNKRIEQLEILLNKHKDVKILVGDFNFSYQDPEFSWIIKKGFKYCEDYQNSTPYNRTDMVFINNELSNFNCKTFKCNFSDHLPIFCNLTIN